jgi:hypothetical protein
LHFTDFTRERRKKQKTKMLLICYEACKLAQHNKELWSKWSHWDAKRTSANNAVKKLGKQKWLRENWVNSCVNISVCTFYWKINYGKLIVEKHDFLSVDAKHIRACSVFFHMLNDFSRGKTQSFLLQSIISMHKEFHKFLNFFKAKTEMQPFAIEFVGSDSSCGNLKLLKNASKSITRVSC